MLNPFGVERPPGEGSELRTIVPTAPQHTLQEWDLSTDVQPEHHPAPEAMPLSEPTVLKPVRSGEKDEVLSCDAEPVPVLVTPFPGNRELTIWVKGVVVFVDGDRLSRGPQRM
jgi:hypothetical protein